MCFLRSFFVNSKSKYCRVSQGLYACKCHPEVRCKSLLIYRGIVHCFYCIFSLPDLGTNFRLLWESFFIFRLKFVTRLGLRRLKLLYHAKWLLKFDVFPEYCIFLSQRWQTACDLLIWAKCFQYGLFLPMIKMYDLRIEIFVRSCIFDIKKWYPILKIEIKKAYLRPCSSYLIPTLISSNLLKN